MNVKNDMHYFMMEKDERPQELHEHIKALVAKIESFGCDKAYDGFTMTNHLLVDKMLTSLTPHYKKHGLVHKA